MMRARRWFAYAALLPLLIAAVALAGPTEDAIDAQINARVYSVLDSLDLIPFTPPDPPPPDPEEPPPLPPPSSDCSYGWKALTGFWGDWCGDETGNFLTNAAGYGEMRSNAQAYCAVGDNASERWADGWVSFEVYFATETIPGTGGGKHVGGPTSYASSFDARPAEGSPRGWLRPDITIRTDTWRVHMYNTDINGEHPGVNDVVSDAWNTGIAVAGVARWIPIRLEWHRTSPTEFKIKFAASGTTREHTYRVQSSSLDIGRLVVGNVDGLTNFGGTPRLYFQKMRFGRL